MIKFDLKELKRQELSFYLGLEKYLVNLGKKEEYFFLWDIGPSIIIGKNQLLYSEVNVLEALKLGCGIFRRPSGGGAIFADSGCFMYSFIVRRKEKNLVYQECLGKLKDTLNKIGLNIEFSGRNDLILDGKKFSGCAMYYEKDYAILHGTFLYDTNLENLVRCVTPSNEKLISKGIKNVSSRVINTKSYLSLTKDELMDYLVKDLDFGIIKGVKDLDISKVDEYKKLFDDKERNYGSNPPYDFDNKVRFPYGEIEIRISINKDKIKDIMFYGDFFLKHDLDEFKNSFIGIEFEKEKIEKVLEKNDVSSFIEGASNIDIIKIIFGG